MQRNCVTHVANSRAVSMKPHILMRTSQGICSNSLGVAAGSVSLCANSGCTIIALLFATTMVYMCWEAWQNPGMRFRVSRPPIIGRGGRRFVTLPQAAACKIVALLPGNRQQRS